jgi:N-hydroxyarylamine O-acetyltransferase
VPFENLDIALGRPIVLDEAALFDKIVERRRGGFCYELNGLFASLLRALGFQVTLLSGGFFRSHGEEGTVFGPDFDHLALRVDLARPWLADVSTFLYPLRLDTADEQASREPDAPPIQTIAEGVWYDRYRIIPDDTHHILQQRDWTDTWQDRFRFTLTPRRLSDFDAMCHYHQTAPESIFLQHRACTRITPTGRVTIADLRLLITEGGERRETELADETARTAALREYCAIVV